MGEFHSQESRSCDERAGLWILLRVVECDDVFQFFLLSNLPGKSRKKIQIKISTSFG